MHARKHMHVPCLPCRPPSTRCGRRLIRRKQQLPLCRWPLVIAPLADGRRSAPLGDRIRHRWS